MIKKTNIAGKRSFIIKEMKIGLLASAQGNLDSAKEGLELLADCQKIIHLGDSIGIGPDGKEVLQLFLEKEVISLRGSYEERLLSQREDEHTLWLREEIGKELREEVAKFPYQYREDLLPKTLFIHWPRSWRSFLPPPASPADKELERIFRAEKEAHIFFGKKRETFNRQIGGKHLLSPGSLGTNELSLAQGMVIEILPKGVTIKERSAFYDPGPVIARLKAKTASRF